MKKIGILTAGGDVQPLNAVISAVVKTAIPRGYEVIGFEKGFEGVLSPMLYRDLTLKSVRGISHTGGTILHSVNKGRFSSKKGAGLNNQIPLEVLTEAKKNLELVGVEALIVVGGDGTLNGAYQLATLGVNIVGIPKTIDNDIAHSDKALGFETTVDIVTDAIDKVHTTATSHDRVVFVEVMGRHAGWIALHGGLAGGADMILIPEIPFSYKNIVEYLRKRKETGYRATVVVVAEGSKEVEGELYKKDVAQNMEYRLGGISFQIVNDLENLAPGEFELRNVVLGHVQRGGSPNAADRVLGKTYGVAAVDAIDRGEFGMMLSMLNGELKSIPLEEIKGKIKNIGKDDLTLETAKKVGVYFGE